MGTGPRDSLPAGQRVQITREKLRKVTGLVAAVFLFVGSLGLGLLLPLHFTTTDIRFYARRWEAYRVPDHVNMTMEDLTRAGTKLIAYLKGKAESPQLVVQIGGERKLLYNEKELAHLADVRNLYQLGFASERFCFGLVAISILLEMYASRLIRLKNTQCTTEQNVALARISRTLKVSGLTLAALLTSQAVAVGTGFTDWWVRFHLVAFENDLWMLDPAQDWLIRMFPEEFFYSAVREIGILAGGSAVFFIVLGVLMHHFSANNGHGDRKV